MAFIPTMKATDSWRMQPCRSSPTQSSAPRRRGDPAADHDPDRRLKMKLALLYEVQAPKPWPDKPYPYNQREAEQAAWFEAIEQIKLADRLGFGTVWVVEHHFRIERSHMPVNDLFLAALSQITENIRLGFGVTLTPHKFVHPVRTAE